MRMNPKQYQSDHHQSDVEAYLVDRGRENRAVIGFQASMTSAYERVKIRGGRFNFIFFLLAFFAFAACREKPPVDNTYYQPYRKPASIQIVDTVKSEGETNTDSVASKAADVLPEQRGVELSDHYFIVIASYSIKELAYNRKSEMERLGYHADVFMQNDDGWYKLAIESYPRKEMAQKALIRIQQLGSPFSEARIVYNP
jgi:hypothetical protein